MRVKHDDNWQKQVGQRLEATLGALNIADADVARAIEITPQRWSNYVNGHRPISVDLAIALCNRYGLTLDWIYRGRIDGLAVSLADKLRPPAPPATVVHIQKMKPRRQ
jgi:transcriptional regulator with XRE-family HTH domain